MLSGNDDLLKDVQVLRDQLAKIEVKPRILQVLDEAMRRLEYCDTEKMNADFIKKWGQND